MSTHASPRTIATTVVHTAQPVTPGYQELFENTSVHQLLQEKKNAIPLVALPSTSTIEEVFDCLLAQDVLSVPIYVPATTTTTTTSNGDDDDDVEYIAFVSAYDLLVFLSSDLNLNEEAMDWIDGTASNEPTADRLATALQQPVSSVVAQPGLNTKVLTVTPNDSVQVLLTLLTQHGHHHAILPIAMCDYSNGSWSISNAKLHKLGHVLDLSVKQAAELRAIPHLPVTLPVNTTASVVFRQLGALLTSEQAPNEGGGAIAIIDDLGGVVAECSAAELRGLNPARIKELRRPILVYLRERAGGNLPRPFICWPNFTLTQCLAGMVRLGVRRAWLVSDTGVLQRVVTLSDILRLFVQPSSI
ncbi:hypothetical protein BDF22DRAFT_746874 [Syncephalis plumigaleata]|nr:hypothetical protein BDF22DRAFT_746874 [Syncephalis plumigaleata]